MVVVGVTVAVEVTVVVGVTVVEGVIVLVVVVFTVGVTVVFGVYQEASVKSKFGTVLELVRAYCGDCCRDSSGGSDCLYRGRGRGALDSHCTCHRARRFNAAADGRSSDAGKCSQLGQLAVKGVGSCSRCSRRTFQVACDYKKFVSVELNL